MSKGVSFFLWKWMCLSVMHVSNSVYADILIIMALCKEYSIWCHPTTTYLQW